MFASVREIPAEGLLILLFFFRFLLRSQWINGETVWLLDRIWIRNVASLLQRTVLDMSREMNVWSASRCSYNT